MKRARWSFILISWGLGLMGSILSANEGWLGLVGILCLWAGGFTIASALGLDFPKAMSDRWPDSYPPENPGS